ncbi:universal stress protein [Flaviramulus sp. BrNp1-15]|uniref:universal stress protein n=1 Tax=Flaviramulus sp. BrNp1-15 TaxID=2916754 RepID=UPI001EE82194|nr:universal stress protein [Flaviramulus sp. BrNp1-15]ULC60760.1 universal stress protein [Flaviramulus sp. BrNp1-15]
MKTILLPTDFSNNSINAINYAIKLFEHIACDFYILNVQKASSFISDDMMTVSSSATIYTTLVSAAKKSITNIISKIEKTTNNKNHTFHSIVDYDNFVDAINQTCQKHDVDLIIMGTKGASGLDKVIFGSNTVRVMQRCIVPVLAIPEGCTFKKLDTIAFTSSFRSSYFIKDLKPLKDLVKLYNTKLKILHVEEDYNFKEKLNENIKFFKEHFIDVTFDRIISNGKDIYTSIHDYVIEKDIKMIAMLSKKHPFLIRLFSKHSVETFAFKIDVPFLVMHNS